MTLPADPTPLDGTRPPLGYVAGLDGMRAVAVLAVLLFHGGIAWATGGFLGVDVFFVLSGFLITTLLIEEVDRHGGIDLRAFWSRRARRLIPALFATVVVVVLAAHWISPARAASSVRLDGAAALGYIANWRFIFSGTSYFLRTAGPSPLEHTWSLAVEEQFYLVWPLIAVLVLRRRAWLLGVVAGVGAAASAIAMAVAYHPGHDASRAYFGTDTRVHVVLVGALAAVLIDRWRRRPVSETIRYGTAELAAFAGAGVLLAIGLAHGDDAFLYRGGFLVVALATAVVITAVVLVPDGLPARILALPPLPWLGRISYALYLWHWPLFLLLTADRTGLRGGGLFGVRCAATLAAAVVSTELLERPLRVGQVLAGIRALVVLPAVAAVAAGVLVLTSVASSSSTTPQTAVTVPAKAVVTAAHAPTPAGQPRRVLFVGDSVAMTLAQGMQSSTRRSGLAVADHAILGCGVVRGGPYRYFGNVAAQPPQCEDWPDRWRGIVAADDPDLAVLLVGRWEVMDRVHGGAWSRIGEPAFDRYLASELHRAIDVLGSHGGKVAVCTAPYYRRGERPDGGIWPEDETWRVDRFNEVLREVVARHPGVTLIDLNGATSRDGRYTPTIDGVRMRYDGVHFTAAGVRHLLPWLVPQLLRD